MTEPRSGRQCHYAGGGGYSGAARITLSGACRPHCGLAQLFHSIPLQLHLDRPQSVLLVVSIASSTLVVKVGICRSCSSLHFIFFAPQARLRQSAADHSRNAQSVLQKHPRPGGRGYRRGQSEQHYRTDPRVARACGAWLGFPQRLLGSSH